MGETGLCMCAPISQFVCHGENNGGCMCVCMKVKPGVCISAVTLLLFNLCCVRFGV